MGISKSLSTVGALLLICVACGKANSPEENTITPKVRAPTPNTSEIKFDSNDLTLDRSKSVPTYRLAQNLDIASSLLIHLDLIELKAHKSLGRELMVVPTENGVEIPEEWPLEGPTPVNGDSIGDVSLSKGELDMAISKCKNYSKIDDHPHVKFLLRIIYSDTVKVVRNNLLIVELLIR